MAGIVVIVAHPHMQHSRANRAMKAAAASAAAGGGIEIRDLYALYPDYLIDVDAEQAALADASLVVWQHPVLWYSMPPLLKLWFDEVLTFGWAYGPGGSALKGKNVWMVVTAGGPADSYHPESYNRYFFYAFLPPFEQTAVLCGMRFLTPSVLHDAHNVADADLAAHAAAYADRLSTYPHWPELEEAQCPPDCFVPSAARPLPGDR